MSVPHSPRQNRLLAALPGTDYERVLPFLEGVDLRLGETLYESGAPREYAYFPISSIVSLLYVTEDGAPAEIAVVGNEGIVGFSVFMGGDTTTTRAVVQSQGHAYRLESGALREEFGRAGAAMWLLLRYAQALMTHMMHTAVCNRHHTIEQQLCRWLLLSLDRRQGNQLALTQEMIANKLGVRRAGITDAAGKLERAGLIRCSRGSITVVDRRRLEHAACECYAVVRKECERLMSDLPSGGALAASDWRRRHERRNRF